MAATFVNGSKTPYAHEKITGMTSSTGLTAANYKQNLNASVNAPYDKNRYADEVFISVETADIRATFDGTTPTVTAGTALGHLFSAGSTITLVGMDAISKFRAINAVDANGASLRVTYWRL